MIRTLITLSLSLAALSLTGCATDNKVIAQANEQQDQLEPAIITDAQVQTFMDRIGQRIVASAKELDAQGVGPKSHKNGEDSSWMFKDVKFQMVNSDTLNAFTTGGHYVYVYSELFKLCKNEDEFAAVCAHEFAHIYCRHVQAGIRRNMTILGGAAAAAVGGAALAGTENLATGAEAGFAVGSAAGQFLGMGFTRKDEDQADQYGFQFYTHAGWDPDQFANFFKTMIAAGYDKTPEMQSDHPKLATRVDNTARRVKELPNTAAQWRRPDTFSASEFAAIQTRVNRISKNPPKGKQAQAAQLMLTAFPSCVAPAETPKQKSAQQTILDALKK